MSATSLTTLTIVFSDPAWIIGTGRSDFATLNASVAAPPINSVALQTLSTSASIAGQDVVGLLYTPDLSLDDPCYNESQPYVPANVTRQGSLPNEDFNLIAVAPWTSAECTLAYLQAAQYDPCNGFLFFRPDEDDTSTPAKPDSPQWDLGDGGAYKSINKYPIYVVNGQTGHALMQQSAQYSGNITGVPHGHLLAAAYDPRDYVRLYVDITLASSGALPLWVFLLIVLGILIGIIAGAFAFMLCLQSRRRHVLRRRIINGEVDLETSGIQRLVVPQNVLNCMPVFEYGTGNPPAEMQQPLSEKHGTDYHALRTQQLQLQSTQPTCAICLDDFIPASSTHPGCAVRQLPCKHVFHPECVDSFLRENSSLCPRCKASTLPKGYCPRVITNRMVRRERLIRKRRERRVYGESDPSTHNNHLAARMADMAYMDDDSTAVGLHAAEADVLHRQERPHQRVTAVLGRRQS